MADLSSFESVGAERMALSLVSFWTRAPRLARALAVGSREEDLTAAVYCEMAQEVSIRDSGPGRGRHIPGTANRAHERAASSEGRLRRAYQSAGVGSIDTEDGDRRLAVTRIGSNGVGSRGRRSEGEGALRGGGPGGADDLSGEHDGLRWRGGSGGGLEVVDLQDEAVSLSLP